MHILFLLHWPLNKPVRGFPMSEHLFHRSQNLGTHIPRNFPTIIQIILQRKKINCIISNKVSGFTGLFNTKDHGAITLVVFKYIFNHEPDCKSSNF